MRLGALPLSLLFIIIVIIILMMLAAAFLVSDLHSRLYNEEVVQRVLSVPT